MRVESKVKFLTNTYLISTYYFNLFLNDTKYFFRLQITENFYICLADSTLTGEKHLQGHKTKNIIMAKQKPIQKDISKNKAKEVVKPISPPPPIEPIIWYKRPMIWAFITGFFAFLLYANTLNHEYAFDDDICTQKNDFVKRGWDGTKDIFKYGSVKGFNLDELGIPRNNSATYRPITLMTFATEQQFFGELKPSRSHLFSVIIYGICVGLLCAFFIRAMKDYPIAIPILIAIMFAAHPLHTESVANVKSRDEVLSVLFFALTMNWLWSYLDSKKIGMLIAATIAYLMALLSKENGITYIAAIPIALFVFRKMEIKDIAKVCIPFAGMALFYLMLRNNILDPMDSKTGSGVGLVVNNVVWGAKGMEKYSTMLYIWLQYFRLLVIPYPLSYDYSYSQIPISKWSDMAVIFSLFLHLGAVAAGVWLTMKRQIAGFGILFYFITFSVISHFFVPVASTMAERFMFAPVLGFCILIVVGIYQLLQKYMPNIATIATIGIFAIMAIGYSFITVKRNPVWKNNETLFASGITSSPNSFRTHYNYAETLRVKAEKTKDKGTFKEAIINYENSFKIWDKEAMTWYNASVCYLGVQDTVKAQYALEKCLALNPRYSQAANNLGVIYFVKKNYEKAREYFIVSYNAGNPDSGSVLSNIGATYQNRGDNLKALEYYEKAYQFLKSRNMPRNQSLLQNLTNLHRITGNMERAAMYEAELGKR